MALKIRNLSLTMQGMQKLGAIEPVLRKALKRKLRESARIIKQKASELAPSPQEETTMLIRGHAAGGAQVPGTLIRDKFFKGTGQVYVRDAILSERPKVVDNFRGLFLNLGNRVRLNRKTGFSWKRHTLQGRQTDTLTTLPFNGHIPTGLGLLGALEKGASGATTIWIVTPRSRTDLNSSDIKTKPLLAPGKGPPYFESITKTIHPVRMYMRAIESLRGAVVLKLKEATQLHSFTRIARRR